MRLKNKLKKFSIFPMDPCTMTYLGCCSPAATASSCHTFSTTLCVRTLSPALPPGGMGGTSSGGGTLSGVSAPPPKVALRGDVGGVRGRFPWCIGAGSCGWRLPLTLPPTLVRAITSFSMSAVTSTKVDG